MVYIQKYGVSSQVPVAHAYNPSYLGDRDQEDHGLKLSWANRPYLDNTQHNTKE
jgi:hypothetical protein